MFLMTGNIDPFGGGNVREKDIAVAVIFARRTLRPMFDPGLGLMGLTADLILIVIF